MTEENFLDELNKIKNKYTWRIDGCGLIRSGKEDYCPLDAIGKSKKFKFSSCYSFIYYKQVAKKLRINSKLENRILKAADNKYRSPLRKKLLAILGLEK